MKKVLIIEDNEDIRENTTELLELSNYEVKTAPDGRQGVRVAQEFNPDIIICDIMMPELDGYGVLQILSKNPDTAGIPFIFLTAKTEKEDIRKGMNLGADDYLTKPFNETDLLTAIETRLKKSTHIRLASNEEQDPSVLLTAITKIEDLDNDRFKLKKLEKKQVLYNEGDYAHNLYYLKSGKIKCCQIDHYGKELITQLILPGNFLAYEHLISEDEYTDTAIALEETLVRVIPKEAYIEFIQNNRDASVQFIKKLSDNIRSKEEQMLKLAFGTVKERTAYFLMKLSEKNSSIQYSREDLAALIGTSTETVIRTLSSFKDDGMIAIKGKEIEVLSIEKIRSLAGAAYLNLKS